MLIRNTSVVSNSYLGSKFGALLYLLIGVSCSPSNSISAQQPAAPKAPAAAPIPSDVKDQGVAPSNVTSKTLPVPVASGASAAAPAGAVSQTPDSAKPGAPAAIKGGPVVAKPKPVIDPATARYSAIMSGVNALMVRVDCLLRTAKFPSHPCRSSGTVDINSIESETEPVRHLKSEFENLLRDIGSEKAFTPIRLLHARVAIDVWTKLIEKFAELRLYVYHAPESTKEAENSNEAWLSGLSLYVPANVMLAIPNFADLVGLHSSRLRAGEKNYVSFGPKDYLRALEGRWDKGSVAGTDVPYASLRLSRLYLEGIELDMLFHTAKEQESMFKIAKYMAVRQLVQSHNEIAFNFEASLKKGGKDGTLKIGSLKGNADFNTGIRSFSRQDLLRQEDEALLYQNLLIQKMTQVIKSRNDEIVHGFLSGSYLDEMESLLNRDSAGKPIK